MSSLNIGYNECKNNVLSHATFHARFAFVHSHFCYHHRLVRNPLGSTHPEATLKACIEHGAPEDAIQAAKAEFHAHLAANRSAQAASSHDLVEDSELLSEDREMDSDTQGKRMRLFWS